MNFAFLRFLEIVVAAVILVSLAVGEDSLSKSSPATVFNFTNNGQIEIVVTNNESGSIKLGRMGSVLGYDQFEIILEAEEERCKLFRDPEMVILVDTREPIEIEQGGFALFKINIFDGTWRASHELSQKARINRIFIRYVPEGCLARDWRKEVGIWEKAFEQSREIRGGLVLQK